MHVSIRHALAVPFVALALARPCGGAENLESLDAVDNQFGAAFQLYVEEPHRAKVAELDGKYVTALEKAQQTATQGGRLEEALALRAEASRVRDKIALPPSDASAEPALVKLRSAYREQLGKLEAGRRLAAEPVAKKYEEALGSLQDKLTRAGKLEDAEAVLVRRKENLAARLLGEPVAAAVAVTSFQPAAEDARPKEVPADAWEFRDHWFKILDGRMSWDTAFRKCQALGGRLAVVPDQDTWRFLAPRIGNSMVWLGASDSEAEGVWKWVDGSLLTFLAWTPGQPNNQDNEDYLHTWKGGWNDNQRDGRWNDGKAFVGGCVCEWIRKPEKAGGPKL